MIVRNEEANLPECLAAVKPHVDEVVVVDTGSDDDTVRVAQELGARVESHPWQSDFGEARTFALGQCRGDWVLWLDADDRIDADGAPHLRGLLRPNPDRAYFFVLQNHGADNSRCLQLRLFPNVPGVQFEGRVHEQVAPSLHRLGIPLTPCDIVVHHMGYSDPEALRAKLLRNRELLELELQDHPGDLDLRLRAAMSEADCGDLAIAIERLSGLLAEPATRTSAQDLFVYGQCLLGKYHERRGDTAAAGEAFRRAVEIDPSHGLAHFFMGRHLLDAGDFDSALPELLRAEAAGIVESRFPVPVLAAQAALALNLGLCLDGRGETDAAKAQYVKAADMDPGCVPAQSRLATIHFQNGELDAAEHRFRKVLDVSPEQPQALFNLGSIAMRRDQAQEAEDLFRRAINAGFRPAMAYTHLGVALQRQGRHADALVPFREALAQAPSDLQALAGSSHSLFQCGQYEAASTLAKHLSAQQPDNATVCRFVAVCAYHLGRTDEARALCERALELDPNAADARRLLETIG